MARQRQRQRSEVGRTRRVLRGAWVLATVAALVLSMTAPVAGQAGTARWRVVIIPVRGEISDITLGSIERRLEQARARGAEVAVFEMDTPGGLVTSALSISKLIKRLPDEGIRTVAWVNDEAFSAGALISVACQKIVMSPASSMGNCAPIKVTPIGGLEELPQSERAKIESPIIQEFRDSAARNGYDPLLCRAMVTVDTEVWWLEQIEPAAAEEGTAGAVVREFVSGEEKKRRIDDVAEEERQWRLVTHIPGPTGQPYEISQPVDQAETLLTLLQTEAVAFGFASAVVGSDSALWQALAGSGLLGGSDGEAVRSSPGPDELVRLEINGWERFAMWLNSPLIRGILLVIVLIGGYIEFQSPGLILPGVTALIALAIFLAAPYAAGLADIWTIILLVVGLVLLAVEIFVLPGFGVAGILGVLLILAAFLGTFIPEEPGAPPFSWPALEGTWQAIRTGIIVLMSSLGAAVVGLAFIVRYLPNSPLSRGILSENPQASRMAVTDPFANVALVGDVGVVTGALRPGGQARFGSEIVEVSSQGEYVEAGRRVQVIRHEGRSIVVRPLPDEA